MVDIERAKRILEGLDPQQLIAARAVDGPVRITAVAGAGKTRTVTRRIAYACLSGRWDPGRTVAVTFSTKAAGEMRSRLARLGVTQVHASTIHSLALSQLRGIWNDMVDAPFPELTSDLGKLASKAVVEVTDMGGLSRREAQDALAEINWTKVSLVAPQSYPEVCHALKRQPPLGLSPEQMSRVLETFEREKAAAGFMDFNDILLILSHLIASNEEVAERVRGPLGWLTVDEYQDISPLQHRLISLWLGPSNRNICVVGDPAQTIYSFDGATSYYLLHFPREFQPLSADVELATDYRSTGRIIAFANRVLSRSGQASDYLRLTPGQGKAAGPFVEEQTCATDESEAKLVADRIARLHSQGVGYDEIAVLSRINSQLHAIVRALDALEIPFAVRRVTSQGQSRETMSRGVVAAVESGKAESLNQKTVTLSTIHAAKGLEWDNVFLIGASDGMIPFRSSTTPEQLEEERRLLYVGVTRGRRRVVISYARSKDGVSGLRREPSRFLR